MGPRGVRINGVPPGAVLVARSPLHHVPEEVRGQVAGRLPLGRLGEPEDIAPAILCLASQHSSWITGVTLDVTGGGIMV